VLRGEFTGDHGAGLAAKTPSSLNIPVLSGLLLLPVKASIYLIIKRNFNT